MNCDENGRKNIIYLKNAGETIIKQQNKKSRAHYTKTYARN